MCYRWRLERIILDRLSNPLAIIAPLVLPSDDPKNWTRLQR